MVDATVVTNNDTTAESLFTMLSTSTTYSCTSCQISFDNGQEQRTHMKSPWHVFNIKRRVESLPPVSVEEFETQTKDAENLEKSSKSKSKRTQKPVKSVGSSEEDNDSKEEVEEEESASPFQCLFCNQEFAEDDNGLEQNIDHMLASHGMSIPDEEMVEDLETFIAYLATEVRVWHECLYCGATKPTTASIQSHMRDKGHCQLNFDREPELLDFWDKPVLDGEDGDAVSNTERPTILSTTEMRFSSGRVIGSKNTASETKKASRRRRLAASTISALPPSSENAEAEVDIEGEPSTEIAVAPKLPSGRQLARREEMGMVGIPMQQRQALVLAEKKAQRSEAMARRAREWVYARGANSQEFDQLDTKLKMGRQNHKLLPR